MNIGILASHPIQYQAPWFRALAKEVDLEVFFAHRQTAAQQGKAGFGVAFDWDTDLLSGYNHRFLNNVSPRPGVDHFSGCNTPEIADIIASNSALDSRLSTFDSPRFDAFIVTGWYLKSYLQAVQACRAAGVPVLVRGDSQLRTPRSMAKRLAMSVRQRWLLRQFDGFLTVGKRNREYLEHYGVRPRSIFLAPHFVANDWFAQQANALRGQRAEIRKQWTIPEDAFCVLFCGKFIPKKRPMDLVEAARLLLTRNSSLPKVHLLFVGSGELGPQLRQACHVVFDAENPNFELSTVNLQLPKASFAGFLNQTEISAAYVAADVIVLPSDGGETWGLVVNEGMACGLPAIVSDAVGCAPDLIDEGYTGFTFPFRDVKALGGRMEQMALMRNQRKDFQPALAAKTNVYSVDVAVKGTIQAASVLSGLRTRQSASVSPL